MNDDPRMSSTSHFWFDDLAPLLWPSKRPNHESAWHSHVSFGHWIVHVTQPDIIVELGTHNGVSFSAFCHGVLRNNSVTRCFAVDTWGGDEQAGFYGNDVFDDINEFNKENFNQFATLMRCTFDEALKRFPDRSVDLLHIDGLHTYTAVKHDFETWLPKMSDRGVVLFHDSVVKSDGFGVWELWRELAEKYPHFNFDHSAGLGVLAVGNFISPPIAALCKVKSATETEKVSRHFADASRFAQQNGANAILADGLKHTLSISNGRANLALGKMAMQSSSPAAEDNTPGGAVNGVKTGRYGFHTRKEFRPWWMVDLGENLSIGELVIYNRLDGPCKERARNLVISSSTDALEWNELYVHDATIFGGVDGKPLRVKPYDTMARFIRISLNEVQFLHLDQVEIFEP